MPDAVTFLVPLQVIYFFLSGRSQYLFLISSALRFLDGVSCFLFTVMDLFQSENSCLQFWNIFLKIISLRILLVSFFFLIISVIRILNFLSRTLIFFLVSTFLPFFYCHFLSFCKNFFKFISLLSKTLILSSLLYFKIPTQLFFVVVPFIQQLILASWMQYLSSFFHSLFPQSYFSSLFVCVSVFQRQEFFRGLVIASHFLPSAFVAIIISELTYQPLVFLIF